MFDFTEHDLKSSTTSQERKVKMKESTREKAKSLKDGQLLWGAASKSSRGQERWLEKYGVGGLVIA